jgi:hypothetical protein
VILGSDSIYQQSPVTLDYKKMILKVTMPDDKEVLFHDESLPSSANMKESRKCHTLLLNDICGVVFLSNQCPILMPERQSQLH